MDKHIVSYSTDGKEVEVLKTTNVRGEDRFVVVMNTQLSSEPVEFKSTLSSLAEAMQLFRELIDE